MEFSSLLLLITTASTVLAATPAPCSSDGFMCRNNCKELVRCVTAGNASLVEQVVRVCPQTIGNYCNATSVDCGGWSCQDEGLNNASITCHEYGVYPHPTDCHQYYNCTVTGTQFKVCSGSSYNGQFQNCSGPIDARPCVETPIPKCNRVEDIGNYPEDPSVFYLCAYDSNGYLRQELHRCNDGYAFDTEELKCLPNSATQMFSVYSLTISIFITFIAFFF